MQSIGSRDDEIVFGLCVFVNRGRTIVIADTNVIEYPTSEELASIAKSSARVAKLLGLDQKLHFYHIQLLGSRKLIELNGYQKQSKC